MQGGYQQGYPPQQQGYPPQQGYPGYPPQQQGYPQPQSGYPQVQPYQQQCANGIIALLGGLIASLLTPSSPKNRRDAGSSHANDAPGAGAAGGVRPGRRASFPLW